MKSTAQRSKHDEEIDGSDLLFVPRFGFVTLAQTQQAAPPANTTSGNGEEPTAPAAQSAKAATASVESGTNTAWGILKDALSDSKTQALQERIDAVTAIGTLGDFDQARKWLRDAGRDPNRYLRLGAVEAMGASKKAIFIPDLKTALEDSAARGQLFAAAVGSFEDPGSQMANFLLHGVLAGQRKVKLGMVGSGMHQANQDLHSPSKLATITF